MSARYIRSKYLKKMNDGAIAELAAEYETLTGRTAILEVRPSRGWDTGYKREYVTDLGIFWGPAETIKFLRNGIEGLTD